MQARIESAENIAPRDGTLGQSSHLDTANESSPILMRSAQRSGGAQARHRADRVDSRYRLSNSMNDLSDIGM